MKKLIAGLLVAAMMAALLSACGKTAEQPAATEAAKAETQAQTQAATTAVPATQAAATEAAEAEKPSGDLVWLTNSSYDKIYGKMVEAYKEYNPNVNITIESYTRSELIKVIDIKMGAGSADYDVFFVDQPLIAAYYWKDYLLPLNEYISSEEQALFTDADLGAGYVQGDLEALPLTSSSQVLMVNKDLLEKAGLSLDDAYYNLEKRLTWEEVADLAQKFQQAVDPNHTEGYWGFVFGQQNNAYQILPLGNSLGEKAVADDGVTIDGVLNTPGWEKALTFYQDMYTTYGVSPVGSTDDETKALFYSGKVLFYVANTIRAAEADFNIAGIYHPYFEGGEVTIPTGSWYLGINKNTEKLDIALDFLKFCTTGDGAEVWMLNNNQVPARKDLLDNMTNDKYEAFREWPGYATTIAAMENLGGNGYMRPTTYGWTSFDSIFTNLLIDLRSGADVKSSLDTAAKQLQSDFNQYR